MAKTAKNKYPADKTGTRYSEFKNTKRVAPGKVRAEKETRPQPANSTTSTTENARQQQ